MKRLSLTMILGANELTRTLGRFFWDASKLIIGSLFLLWVHHLRFSLRVINAGVVLKLREQRCGGSAATGQMARKWRGRACLISKACVLPSTGCLLLSAVMVSGPRPWDADRARRNWLCFCLWLCSSEAFPSKAGLSSSDPKKLSPGSLAPYPHSMGFSGQEGKLMIQQGRKRKAGEGGQWVEGGRKR